MNSKRLWGGFRDGVLDIRHVDTGWGGFGKDGDRLMPAIFMTKREACEQYEDVRPVKIFAIPNKRKKR